MSTDFHTLKIKELVKETEESISVIFDVPDQLKDQYQFKAGQYLTLKFDKNGQEYRRAYSIFTSPLEQKLGVTSKRVKNGVISNHMNDNLTVGQDIEVMVPLGTFTLDLSHAAIKDYYLFAGGSGITPMMSLIKTILEEEPKSTVNLFYGNTNESSIIFKNELDRLEKMHSGQFTATHLLSDPIKTKSGFFSKAKTNWTGWKGLPNAENISKFLQEQPAKGDDQIYMICGPTVMMDVVQAALLGQGIQKDKIKVEYFGSPDEKSDNAGEAVAAASGAGVGTVTVSLKGEEFVIDVPPSKTILDVLLEMKKDAPFSCTSGACSTCIAKVTSGKVEMDACYALDDDEVESGFILACQAHPVTDDVKIVFED
jgi:ring-1,2-phenylacetyl-CoA epoxidase subunit PaaE